MPLPSVHAPGVQICRISNTAPRWIAKALHASPRPPSVAGSWACPPSPYSRVPPPSAASRDLLEKDALSWAIQLSTSTLVVLDVKAVPFTRLWCLYEMALADRSGRPLELLSHNKDTAAMRLFEMELSRAALGKEEVRSAITQRLTPAGESLHDVSNSLRASLNKRLLGGYSPSASAALPHVTPPPPRKRGSAPAVRCPALRARPGLRARTHPLAAEPLLRRPLTPAFLAPPSPPRRLSGPAFLARAGGPPPSEGARASQKWTASTTSRRAGGHRWRSPCRLA